jgi:hypothetical protein
MGGCDQPVTFSLGIFVGAVVGIAHAVDEVNQEAETGSDISRCLDFRAAGGARNHRRHVGILSTVVGGWTR